MTEFFYVVDENDNVIGRATRKECHVTNQHIHRSVYIFVINSKNEIFLQKRSNKKDLYPGYCTGSATGHVEYGETYESAAKRELKEELGIENVPIEIIAKFKCFSEIEREISALFICKYEGPLKLDKKEIEEGGFFSIEEIKKALQIGEKKFALGFKLAFKEFMKYYKHNRLIKTAK
ncbi:TPA: NUDIX domain-containing protein [Candidatus Bathyarchaeota archaeon]|nr:NUDIX domain-containing protein [Candidatus Bathyarchaeota archaeon]